MHERLELKGMGWSEIVSVESISAAKATTCGQFRTPSSNKFCPGHLLINLDEVALAHVGSSNGTDIDQSGDLVGLRMSALSRIER